MLSKVLSLGLNGLDGYVVDVEVNVAKGLPSFDIVGLPDTTVKESKERVVTAIQNSGLFFPSYKITVNLAPAGQKKEGAYYDLPLAIGVLSASSQIKVDKDAIFIGELSLNGEIREVKGILPLLIFARKKGFKKFFIPKLNKNEASFISDIEVYAPEKLSDIINHYNGKPLEKIETKDYNLISNENESSNDFKFVKGQEIAKRAIEIAVAGGHNILLIGPPGMGKTMLAKAIPSIMPKLTFEEALEITKIHSIAGTLNSDVGIITNRPFRTPHHTATTVALCGGGSSAKPGEISLANHGVLFLDELPEYPRNSIETLRQPLEDRVISVARAMYKVDYPASFMLVASMNPCPCGNYGSKNQCRCTQSQIVKYLSKLSGPLVDRIDLQIEIDYVDYSDLTNAHECENSQDIKIRVEKTREIQRNRFCDVRTNAQMKDSEMKKFCHLSKECENLLKLAFENLSLSIRGRSRIIKVARTIADLDGSKEIDVKHIAEAINYRALDRKYFSKGRR